MAPACFQFYSFLGLRSNAQDDPLDQLRNTIPGEPGVDYPIMSSIEDTGFDCQGKVFGGFYADPGADCQIYHVCLQVSARKKLQISNTKSN